jgi:hypothetical protein
MSSGHRARVHALSGGGSSAAISVMRGDARLGQSRCRNTGKHYRNANAKEAVHRFKLPVPPELRTILKPPSSATCRRKLRALSFAQQWTIGGVKSLAHLRRRPALEKTCVSGVDPELAHGLFEHIRFGKPVPTFPTSYPRRAFGNHWNQQKGLPARTAINGRLAAKKCSVD